MAKTTGKQLVRVDRAVSGVASFYDARVENAQAGLIGRISIADRFDGDLPADVVRATIHGWVQVTLDTSNSLTGDDRIAYIKKSLDLIRQGVWPSAPVDEAKQLATMASMIAKLTPEQRAALGIVTPTAGGEQPE